MTGGVDEDAIRTAAIEWVRRATLEYELPITRDRLTHDFHVGAQPFPLIDAGRGIRKPAGWSAALSILTAAPGRGHKRPYEDEEGPDGLQRYKFRRDDRGASENAALRAALLHDVPLIWFYGLEPALYQAIAPVHLLAEEKDQFVLALTQSQRLVTPGSQVGTDVRRYLVAETRRRLHQPLFAHQVMRAYQVRCSVCRIGHRELLDAAHILPDSHPRGVPVVANGLALCKIHHAAYDQNILGIRPDYVIEIQHRLLEEIDGPMLRHGLQEHHSRPLMQLPRLRAERPDPDRLEERYAQFRAA